MEGVTLFRSNLVVSLALVIGSLFFRSAAVLVGVSIGCLIGLVNCALMTVLVKGVLTNRSRGRGRLFGSLALKILLIFPIIGLILLKTDVRALPLLVGLSNTFLAVLHFGLKDYKHA